jgi:hypothetical protein
MSMGVVRGVGGVVVREVVWEGEVWVEVGAGEEVGSCSGTGDFFRGFSEVEFLVGFLGWDFKV